MDLEDDDTEAEKLAVEREQRRRRKRRGTCNNHHRTRFPNYSVSNSFAVLFLYGGKIKLYILYAPTLFIPRRAGIGPVEYLIHSPGGGLILSQILIAND